MDDAQTVLRRAIADEVAGLMGKRGRMKQTQLSALTGLSQSYLSRRLDCSQGFDVEALAKIAAALDSSVVDIISAAATFPTDPGAHSSVG